MLDLDEKTRDDLTRRYRAKETVARLGGARRDGALTELGASNPLLEGEAWNTASESERSRRVSRTHDVDSGALGDVPQFFKDEAENFKSSSIGFSSGAGGERRGGERRGGRRLRHRLDAHRGFRRRRCRGVDRRRRDVRRGFVSR